MRLLTLKGIKSQFGDDIQLLLKRVIRLFLKFMSRGTLKIHLTKNAATRKWQAAREKVLQIAGLLREHKSSPMTVDSMIEGVLRVPQENTDISVSKLEAPLDP